MAVSVLRVIGGIHMVDGGPVDRGMVIRLGDAARVGVSSRGSSWAREGIGLACTTAPADAVVAGVVTSSREGRGECVVTFDGRIDNRKELIGELSSQGVDTTSGDAGLILAAYGEWGDQCPLRLVGDFAFGLWDARAAAAPVRERSGGCAPAVCSCAGQSGVLRHPAPTTVDSLPADSADRHGVRGGSARPRREST